MGIFLLHARLLRLPYFWDEAGYYVPAARDLLLTGSLIPHSTLSNAHPPLVMAWLALCWRFSGYTPVVTRTAMLLIAAFALLGIFRLAERAANRPIAAATTVCSALYPVFFAQSSLAHLDLAAAALTFWGLAAYIDDRRLGAVVWFSLAALAKETAILAPLALFAWELLGPLLLGRDRSDKWCRRAESDKRRAFLLLLPLAPLSLWFAYHCQRTGYVFGNPEFFRYNVEATLNPTRILLTLLMRLWQSVGYLHLLVLTVAGALAMKCAPLVDAEEERPRIRLPVQAAFAVVIAAYIVAMAVVGGAVLARYMLPVVPLVILIWVSTLWRRLRRWREVVAVVCVMFVTGWFWNPPYGFAMEDNLAYRDYIELHQLAEDFVEARYPMARVLTAWPASDEISRPFLGYVSRPLRVVRLEDFSLEQVLAAAEARSTFEVALLFSTKYEPPPLSLGTWPAWERIKMRLFGYHRDLPPETAAQILGGRIVFSQKRNGQWVAVVVMERVVDAELRGPAGIPETLQATSLGSRLSP